MPRIACVAAWYDHAAAPVAVGLARKRAAGHGQKRHSRIERVQGKHAVHKLVPLVAEVVHVAVGDHVQAGRDFHDFDLVSAVNHRGELCVGAHVIRAGV